MAHDAWSDDPDRTTRNDDTRTPERITADTLTMTIATAPLNTPLTMITGQYAGYRAVVTERIIPRAPAGWLNTSAGWGEGWITTDTGTSYGASFPLDDMCSIIPD